MASFSYFLYGMSVMFYSMMAWMFGRKGNDMLSKLIMWLMIIQCIELFKDLGFYTFCAQPNDYWHLMTAIDMIIIPLYVFVLMELCKPGWFSFQKLMVHELPFVTLPLLFFFTEQQLWYIALVVWGAIYGTGTLVLTFFFISQYNLQLKERFSYEENINLNWLRGILVSFWIILLIWTIASVYNSELADDLYSIEALVLWMIVCYFGYKHESVIDELGNSELSGLDEVDDDDKNYQLQPELGDMVKDLFEKELLYLNPRLKLSDVARKVGSNRTYLSRYFNRANGLTFYDFVNNMRIKHAEELLISTTHPVAMIAEESGFNSMSTFRRVFMSYHNCTPAEYRTQKKVPTNG